MLSDRAIATENQVENLSQLVWLHSMSALGVRGTGSRHCLAEAMLLPGPCSPLAAQTMKAKY